MRRHRHIRLLDTSYPLLLTGAPHGLYGGSKTPCTWWCSWSPFALRKRRATGAGRASAGANRLSTLACVRLRSARDITVILIDGAETFNFDPRRRTVMLTTAIG